MKKKVAILQSSYIPWKGYFDLINMVDEFIIFDDVHYTKKSWRNRNCIKTPSGKLWLSIPVKTKGRFFQNISEVKVANQNWRSKHWKTIKLNYQKAKYFEKYSDLFAEIYKDNVSKLCTINLQFIERICSILKIRTKINNSNEYGYVHQKGRLEPIIKLIKDAGGSIFINGPTAKSYMSNSEFSKNGIDLIWMDYTGYPEYPQLYPPFIHEVSIVDLIFNTGPHASDYLLSRRRVASRGES